MDTNKLPRFVRDEEQVGTRGRFMGHLYLRYRKLAAVIGIPLVVVACIILWTWIPMTEANYQQKELAREFFNQCYLTFEDTSQIPRAPEEALRVAQKKQSVTMDAFRAWSPQVWGEIRDGYWWARIQFSTPKKRVFEKRIGVAVNDVGYNTPSEKSQRLEPESVEP